MAAAVLDCLTTASTDFAILHGEAAVADGDCSSDVDLVTRADAGRVIEHAREHLRRRNLHPVVVWPYDVGSASVFVVDAHARDGAQFDILHDPAGRGHYGVRAGAILARARPGVRWRRAAPDDELLYLIRKRLHKGQGHRLSALLAEAGDVPRERLRDRARELFSARSAGAVTAALDGHEQPPDRLQGVREALANAGRFVSRVRQPVGFWVAVDGAGARPVAELIASRFGRVLPAAGTGETATMLTGLLGGARQIAPVRWRAGVYSSWGARHPALHPDLVVRPADKTTEQVLGEVVSAMERRLRQ